MTKFIGPIIVLLLSSIAFVIHFYKLSKRRKFEISKLNKEVSELKKQITDQGKKLDNFKGYFSKAQVMKIIENLPKFKVGDIVGEFTVWGLVLCVALGKTLNPKKDYSAAEKAIKNYQNSKIIYSYRCHKTNDKGFWMPYIGTFKLPHIKTEEELVEIFNTKAK